MSPRCSAGQWLKTINGQSFGELVQESCLFRFARSFQLVHGRCAALSQWRDVAAAMLTFCAANQLKQHLTELANRLADSDDADIRLE